ncbi:response regulator transcription factor [bacterium]|nr:response regulator transcription factor [bacterium]RQV92926.1 MAG: DNA-binding response regulator [bacterium]
MEKILIIEDEESILMPLEDDLKLEGYAVSSARDGNEGFSMAKESRHDLIILDLMLPGMNGFDVCRKLRECGITTPILILSAKSQVVDKVLGLELGADDYVTKPFSPRELQARIKAILRRIKQIQQGIDGIRFGKVEVDFIKYETKREGKPVYLTSLEYALLHYLVRHKDQVASRDSILNEVWGEDVYVFPRTVDTHIAHLRKKIEDNPAEPKHVLNIRGAGYKFVE